MSERSKSKSAILFIAAGAVLIASVSVKNSEQQAPRLAPVATAPTTPKAVSAVEVLDLVVYPEREGLAGIVDRTKDKVQNLKSGG